MKRRFRLALTAEKTGASSQQERTSKVALSVEATAHVDKF